VIQKRPVTLLIFLLFVVICHGQQGFRKKQQAYPRVREAYSEKWEHLSGMLATLDIDPGAMELYLIAYKKEKQLEVWTRDEGEKPFRLLTTYDICRTSGGPGPKRREGDRQIPEGFYHISAYNPWSNFHLSMCINYPNRSDRVLGVKGSLGGDICIHGSCVTVGCIPLTNSIIKELYILCTEARNNGQIRIPVTIYPARLNRHNYNQLVQKQKGNEERLNLWSDMKTAYERFLSTHRLPEITFLPNGRHTIR
jgi:murein L,D-transpeptidase YafK